MNLIQNLILLLVAATYGIVQTRRSQSIRLRLRTVPSLRLRLGGLGIFVLGFALLFFALFVAESIDRDSAHVLSPAATAILAVFGCAFLHCATMGTAMLVTLVQREVTENWLQASRSTGTDGIQLHEETSL